MGHCFVLYMASVWNGLSPMDHLTDKLYLHNSKLHVVIKLYAFKKSWCGHQFGGRSQLKAVRWFLPLLNGDQKSVLPALVQGAAFVLMEQRALQGYFCPCCCLNLNLVWKFSCCVTFRQGKRVTRLVMHCNKGQKKMIQITITLQQASDTRGNKHTTTIETLILVKSLLWSHSFSSVL